MQPNDLGEVSRRYALDSLIGLFDSGNVVDVAYASEAGLPLNPG
jgi:hypothetical protein